MTGEEGGGGLSDFFGSEILAKGNFFGSERCLGPFYLSCSFIFRNKREKKDEKRVEHRKTYKPGDYFICSVASFSEMREIG